MSASYVPTTQLTFPSSGYDYRPAMGADNSTFVFERYGTDSNGDPTCKLYWGSANVQNGDVPTVYPVFGTGGDFDNEWKFQSRPDWCLETGEIIFNASRTAKGPLAVFIMKTMLNPTFFDQKPQRVGTLEHVAYPRWNFDGMNFVGMSSYKVTADTCPPVSTWYDRAGDVYENWNNLNGVPDVTSGNCMYGGMPAVALAGNAQPGVCLPYIAYAGQAYNLGTNPPLNPTYDENTNYIYLNNASLDPLVSFPLEFGAVGTENLSAYQGRAPDTSPLGDAIVFESNRPGDDGCSGIYAIFLANVTAATGGSSPLQITSRQVGTPGNCAGNAQHAKFYSHGDFIIFCAQPNTQGAPMAIFTANIASVLQQLGCRT